jgi:DNA-binding MarR family transcriptional regulator
MDFINQLGALMLDHRFKRMMQRLLDEAEAIYSVLNIPIKPRWVSTLLLLEKHGPVAVMDIAEQLSVTHPAVIQLVQDMAEAGLVADVRDESDGRRRLLVLTPAANSLLPTLKRVWEELAKAQAEAFRVAGCDIMSILDRVEGQLDRTRLATVVLKRLNRMKIAPEALSGLARPSLSSPHKERKVAQ